MEKLFESLMRYGEGPDYPYHMPGHKRTLFGKLPGDLFKMDITEIDGFDDLHAPEGVIATMQERAAALYGAQESFCLVGGSTAGILTAISAAVPMGGHLLMARNCHKSAYHAAYLRRLQVSYLFPEPLEGYGIAGGITPEQVVKALELEPDIQAVLVVSPTYEGRISPIREIAKEVHDRGKLLIVDEAHGAHLGLFDPDIVGSCQAGADLVIHSIHKTLPAMTQTALLHVNGERVNRELVRRFLHIYQSSSPSYVLMASIDNCITLLEQEGKTLYERFREHFLGMMKELERCRHIRVLGTGVRGRGPGIGEASEIDTGLQVQDIGKLLIYPEPGRMTGQELYDLLRERYHLQLEMAAEEFCLAMFTIGDTEEGFRRMRDALLEIDRELAEAPVHKKEKEQRLAVSRMAGRPSGKARLPFSEAWDLPWEEILLEECAGRISADFISLYPPGTPILTPGEGITQEILDELLSYRRQGLRLRGLCRDNSYIKCLIEQ